MNTNLTSVVICCAGMGTRLGIGTTKALVDICGKPLIIRQLELLDDYDDIRIVVGYQAERVIDVVTQYRQDVVFAFNYDFETTGVAVSLKKGLLRARKYTVAMDGDLLVNPMDFHKFLNYNGECLAASKRNSSEPILMEMQNEQVVGFSEKEGQFEWPGLAKLQTNKLKGDFEYVYDMIQPLLPMKPIIVRTREIDTPEDYEKAIEWVKNGYIDEER